jgi:nitrate/TMAO reductase-like tetraheme cytochrome c subunit
MRYLLTALAFFSLLGTSQAAWRDIFQTEAAKPKVEQNVCILCHDSDLIKPEYRDIPGEWRKSWHYANGVSCQDCHGGDPKDATKAMLRSKGFLGAPKYDQVPGFCGKCHIGILENYQESGHGKALKSPVKGIKGPNCVTCHGSHDIQPADIEIINEGLCGSCHSYDRAKEMKASLFLTEKKIKEIDHDLKTLKAGLISTEESGKVLFQTQAEFRTLFHTVDVKLVNERTAEFTKRLTAIEGGVQQGFKELKFRENFAMVIMLIFVGLGVTIFLLGRRPE